MSIAAFLHRVAHILEEAGVPYMLTGSLAAAYYATPRATQDIDVVIDAQEEGVEKLVQGLLDAGLYVDREAALDAWRAHGQFNAIDPESGWKVDLIVRKNRSFSKTEFERRKRADLLGIEVSLASLEDVLISKLEWARIGDSELQRGDVVRLLERSWDQLDPAYLERWISDLGLQEEWSSVLTRTGQEPPIRQADLELARSSIPERDPREGVNLFTLRGKPALVLLGLVLFLFVANALYYRNGLSDAEAQAVRRSLTLHYRANLLAGADPEGMNPGDRREVTALLGDFRDVELTDGAVKGWGRSRVVRVDVAVAGGPPPDGVSPRHLILACRRSCVVMGPVGPLSFALGLWFMEAEGGAFP